ncbi:Neurogenic locus notch-like protein 1 [Trichoplax sp. H2]|nr:Neurogenic locus notch-like protein 1 [Trichoplax sp. H2]|eukprot:RDD39908.1 Neurogenic locus notch-like protein 1 [Trichoplax sp. H2]
MAVFRKMVLMATRPQVNATDPCIDYTVISDKSRSIFENLGTIGCDRNLTNSWYRFDGGQNSQMMQTTCIEQIPKCGTLGPGWMIGKHPTVGDRVVNRTVCFYSYDDCCFGRLSIQVQNCRQFFVYRLPSTINLLVCAGYCTTKKDPCNPNPCVNDGECRKANGAYQCKCQHDFTGKNCENNVNPCKANPCRYGNCSVAGNDYKCTCFSGYTGENCDQDIDECTTKLHDCQEICGNTRGSYRCSCRRGNILLSDQISCFNPCRSAIHLTDTSRSIYASTYRLTCDQSFLNGSWYRFNGGPKSQMMLTSRVSMVNCGTVSPGWLVDNHPTMQEGIISARVCFIWGINTCKWNQTIHIRNCGSHFVYKLPPPSTCYLRYCSDKRTNILDSFNGLLLNNNILLLSSLFIQAYCDPDPCVNGTCQTTDVGFRCHCQQGYRGMLCQHEIDECASNPCQHGRCINTDGSYRCECHIGFTGQNCDTDINECDYANGNCSQNCINLPGSYHCQCRLGFILEPNGRECIDPCMNFFWLRNTSRWLSNRNADPLYCDKHTLKANWYRISSTSKDMMLPNQCTPVLRCQTLSTGWLNGTHPRVRDGVVNKTVCFNYNGNCCYMSNTIMVKNCISYFVYYLTPTMTCSPETRYCTTDFDVCDPNPCFHGDCVNVRSDQYRCRCKSGFTGKHCETAINECSSNPCVRGRCVDSIGKYRCICDTGMTGVHCDQDVNECLLSNGGCDGACHNQYASYYCSCPVHQDLDSDNRTCIDPCNTQTSSLVDSISEKMTIFLSYSIVSKCQKVSLLAKSPKKWYRASLASNCSAIARWTGHDQGDEYLQIAKRNACFHFGLQHCAMTLPVRVKHCRGYYMYKIDRLSACYLNFCSRIQDNCDSSPCQNGVCVSTQNGYECRCKPGYHGVHCEVDVCSLNPCYNGRCTVTESGNYNCICREGYSGKQCETAICYTKPRSCLDLIKRQKSYLPSGYYQIYDKNGCQQGHMTAQGLLVYCDFESEPGYAWTLIESFSRFNAQISQINKGFAYSDGFNSDSPRYRWQGYRMTLDQMWQLYQVNRRLTVKPMWRATCNFNPNDDRNHYPKTDYLRGLFDILNILKYNSLGDCYLVDSVNIRSFGCRQCMVPFWSSNDVHLHIDSSRQCCTRHFYDSVESEDNFGYYHPYSTAFSCTATFNSTTNWWIGGKIHDNDDLASRPTIL